MQTNASLIQFESVTMLLVARRPRSKIGTTWLHHAVSGGDAAGRGTRGGLVLWGVAFARARRHVDGRIEVHWDVLGA